MSLSELSQKRKKTHNTARMLKLDVKKIMYQMDAYIYIMD